MPRIVFSLFAFAIYTLTLILMTGQSFAWKETKSTFYLGGKRVPMFSSLATFCATWMSPLSLVAYTMYFYSDGYVAFMGSVNGWMLGFLFFPWVIKRLRATKALSLPEWLQLSYGGDIRVRKLVAATMVFLYILYLVIQFRSFGVIVSSMLQINVNIVAAALIYLFVLYTTFGGYPSVVRSDTVNLILIVSGVTIAAVYCVQVVIGMGEFGALVSPAQPAVPKPEIGLKGYISTLALMLTWGLGVAANPQYAVRIIACRSRKEAYKMMALAPFVIAWIYFAATLLIMCCRIAFPIIAQQDELLDFTRLAGFLSPVAETSLLIAVIAAAVSTANSQLLLAASSLCYDLFPPKPTAEERSGPYGESGFLFVNRISIAVIASVALVLSQLNLPDSYILGKISWTLVVGCFFFPFFVPSWTSRKYLFHVLAGALVIQCASVFIFKVTPEYGMLLMLFFEGVAFGTIKYGLGEAPGAALGEGVK